jgi:hypothetical protein
MTLARIDHLIDIILRAKWSPFRRWPDMVLACIILTFISMLAMFQPTRYLTANTVFAKVPENSRALVGSLLGVAIVAAFFYPLAGGLMCVGTGGLLRLYDAIHQESIVGVTVYGLIALVALLRIYGRWRKDDEMRDVIAQARHISAELTHEHVRHERALVAIATDPPIDIAEHISTKRNERQDHREDRQDRREQRLDEREIVGDARDERERRDDRQEGRDIRQDRREIAGNEREERGGPR